MKKLISLILTAALLVSLAAASHAESPVGYTPADVMEWYLADQDNAADITEQSVNAASRTAENLVYVAGLNANEEQLGQLQDILDSLTELRSSADLSAEQKLGVSCVYIVKTLIVLALESDPEGVYGEQLQGIVDHYNELDAAADSPDLQAVNALYTSIKLAALVTEECCTSQDQIDQIEAGLSELNAESGAASITFDHLIIGSRWLRRVLGAFAKLNNPNCVDAIGQEMEIRENLVSGMTDPMEMINQYLISSMYALGIFTGHYSLD